MDCSNQSAYKRNYLSKISSSTALLRASLLELTENNDSHALQSGEVEK